MRNCLFIILLIIPVFFSSAEAQYESIMPRALEEPKDNRQGEHEFIFIRAKYSNYINSRKVRFGGRGGGRGWGGGGGGGVVPTGGRRILMTQTETFSGV